MESITSEDLNRLIVLLVGAYRSWNLSAAMEILDLEEKYTEEYLYDVLLDNNVEQCEVCSVWFDEGGDINFRGQVVCQDCMEDSFADPLYPSDDDWDPNAVYDEEEERA